MAKIIGIHQENCIASDAFDIGVEERRDVFWVLFVLDKQMCVLTGNSYSISSSDCDVQLPRQIPGSFFNQQFLARIQLALLQERIYSGLYSTEGIRQTSGEVERVIDRLSTELQKWYDAHELVLTDQLVDGGPQVPFVGAEMTFWYYNCCVLVLRRSSDSARRSQSLQDSRSAISSIQRIWERKRLLGDTQWLRRYTFKLHCPITLASIRSGTSRTGTY